MNKWKQKYAALRNEFDVFKWTSNHDEMKLKEKLQAANDVIESDRLDMVRACEAASSDCRKIERYRNKALIWACKLNCPDGCLGCPRIDNPNNFCGEVLKAVDGDD